MKNLSYYLLLSTTLSFIALACANVTSSEDKPIKQKPAVAQSQTAIDSTFFVTYKSPTHHIQIQFNQLSYRKTEQHFAPNSVSAVPDSTSIILLAENVAIPLKKLNELKQMVAKEFWQLKEEYGGPENERFYPYRINVKTGNQEKSVLFRSNPAYEKAPEGFKKLEQYLLNLESSKFEH